jgi:hypothetical protein
LNGRTNWKPEPFERAAGSTIAAVKKRHQARRQRQTRHNAPRKPYLRAVPGEQPRSFQCLG